MIPNDPTIADLLADIGARAGDRIAVDDGDTQITYRALLDNAARLATRIAALVPRGRPVGVLLPSATRFIVAITAAMLSGRPFVPLDPKFPAARNGVILDHADLGAILVDAAGAEAMLALRPSLPQIRLDAREPTQDALPAATPDDAIFIYYTSGSTGRPKGVVWTQRSIIRQRRSYIDTLSIGGEDRVAMLYGPTTLGGNRDILSALLAGARLCIVDLTHGSIAEARQRLAAHGITILHCVPPVFRLLIGDGDGLAGLAETLRFVHLQGDRITPADLDRFQRGCPTRCRLQIAVSTTETASYVSWLVDPADAVEQDLVAAGRPTPDVQLRLIDADGSSAPTGHAGEIIVTTRFAAAGYWRDEAATRAKFLPSATTPGAIDYHTGDIGRFRANGLLDFIGRRDRMVKVNGYSIHPGETEAVMAALPGLRAAAVIPRPAGTETALIAYGIVEAPGGPDRAAIRAWCAARLPSFLCPAEIILVDAIPMLAPGKPDYAALAALDRDRPMSVAAGPADEPLLTRLVRTAWERILPGTVDLGRSFAECGGDSLKGLALFGWIEQQLGRPLPADLLAKSTSPAMLIDALAALAMPVPPKPAKRALFFFPSHFTQAGDVRFTEFYRRLSDHFDLRVADYRDLGDGLEGVLDTDRLFREVAAAMVQAGLTQPILVAGYSFGMRIAAEAARIAVQQGGRVAQLINLDGWRETLPISDLENEDIRSRAAGVKGLIYHVLDTRLGLGLIRYLVAHRYLASLRLVLAAVPQAGTRRRYRHYALVTLRRQAFDEIPRGAIKLPMILLRSDDANPYRTRHPDLGWRPWVDEITIRPVGGSHAGMVDTQLEAIVAEILRLR